MSKTIIDIKGQRFCRLTAIRYVKNGVWLCECECGNTKMVDGTSLRRGKVKSCGCLLRERTIERSTKHHGSYDRLYRIWSGMKYRCFNADGERYKDYGGRGITVCDEWLDYSTFREWANNSGYDPAAPFGTCTLDRIDTNGNYEPSNCRWVDYHAQALNRRPIKKPWKCRAVNRIDADGQILNTYSSVTEASEDTGCSVNAIVGVCCGRYKTTHKMMWEYADEGGR